MKPTVRPPIPAHIAKKARRIRLLALDVDGVLTDGRIVLDDLKGHSKSFDVHDGLGLVLFARSGLKTAIITAERSQVVTRRARAMKIAWVAQYARNKRKAYDRLKVHFQLLDEDICFIGDDLLDLPVLKRVGLSVATANAVPEAHQIADYITHKPGGRGAVREVVEMILKTQGRWVGLVEELLEA
ncbi:MAG: HAD hydrolase family protein [Candidatus Omnitrophica bacterium]|nr:HAD hydrolase family protein [Candidatus Omnitrophota bacterium]